MLVATADSMFWSAAGTEWLNVVSSWLRMLCCQMQVSQEQKECERNTVQEND